MSGFVIDRHNKLKSIGHVQAAINHNDRTTKPKNADPSRLHLNHFKGDGMAKLRTNLASVTQASTAKEPVLALEYLVTATPEQINSPDFDRKAYFKAAKAYLDKLLGAENFIHEAVHYDERSVHGHFIYTPIIELEASTRRRSVVVGKTEDGKQKREVRECATKAGRALNAKKFTGRDASIALQTTFAEEVGVPFGLRRGIAGSKAKHTEIKAFYGQLQRDLADIQAKMGRLAEQEAAQDERGDDLDQRGVDVWAREKALETERLVLAEYKRQLDERIAGVRALSDDLKQIEAGLNERKAELDAEVERQVSGLETWELDLQSREAELAVNPPTPALKSRSKVLDALVAALPETLIRELPAELRKAVRGVQERNNNQGLSR